MAKNGYKLPEEIKALSVGDTWDKARLEWRIDRILLSEEPKTCLCGKTPINELCYLRNQKNGNRVLVGNECVKKFLPMDVHLIFDAIKRVAEDETKPLNADTIDYAHQQGWIGDNERSFYLETWRKQTRMSQRQMAWRIRINRKILGRATSPKRRSA